MNGVRDVLAQADSVPTDVFYWVGQMENSDADKRRLAASNFDSANDGNFAVTSGVG